MYKLIYDWYELHQKKKTTKLYGGEKKVKWMWMNQTKDRKPCDHRERAREQLNKMRESEIVYVWVRQYIEYLYDCI